MSETERLWQDVVTGGRARVVSDMDRDAVDALARTARSAGALVLMGAFDPVAAGVGLGPLPSLVNGLLADLEIESAPPTGQWWVRPALDDLLGRSELHRDLSEIYSAIALVLMLAADDRAVTLVLEGIEWASDAARNLLPYLEESVDAPVLIVTTSGGHPRQLTAEAHVEVADELAAGDRAKTEPELVGAHLAQAIAADRAPDPEMLHRAAWWLGRAGRSAIDRSDMVSGARLLERAATLLPAGTRERLHNIADSCEALLATGRADEIAERTRRGIDEAKTVGDHCAEARLRVWELMVDEAITTDDPPVAQLEALEATLAECGDDVGIAQTREALAHIAWITNDADRAIANMQQGLVAAYRAQARTLLSRMAVSYLTILAAGPLPVTAALARFEGVGPVAQRSSFVEIALKANAALLFALDGHFDFARLSLGDAEAIQAGLKQPPWVARVPRIAGTVELLAGDPAAALRSATAELYQLLDMNHPAGVDAGVIAARAMCELERFRDAADLCGRALRALSSSEGSEAPEVSEGEIEGIHAYALAAQGRNDDAVASIARSDATPPPPTRVVQQADRLVDTAAALALLGKGDDAGARLDDALGLYRLKQATRAASVADDRVRRSTKNV